jgi:hypothetical protein
VDCWDFVSVTSVMAPASGLSPATEFKASADMPGIPLQVRCRLNSFPRQNRSLGEDRIYVSI